MRVRFNRDYDFSPKALNGHVTTAYRAGTEETVTRECGEAAVAAGAAEEIAPSTEDSSRADAKRRG